MAPYVLLQVDVSKNQSFKVIPKYMSGNIAVNSKPTVAGIDLIPVRDSE